MKTKKSLILLGIVFIFLSCSNRAKKIEAFNKIPYDQKVEAYLKLAPEEIVPEINEDVSKIVIQMITDGNEITPMHITAFKKAVGSDSVCSYLLTPDSVRCWVDIPDREFMDIVLENDTIKEKLYEKVNKGRDYKAAIWLFAIKPDSVLKRISSGFYDAKVTKLLKSDLLSYCERPTTEYILKTVSDFTPDSVLTGYMGGGIENLIYQRNPERIKKIYSLMSAWQICNIAEYGEENQSYKTIGRDTYLKANLSRSNARDLIQLYDSKVIDWKCCKEKLFNQSITDLINAYESDVCNNDYVDIIIYKTQQKSSENEQSKVIDFLYTINQTEMIALVK